MILLMNVIVELGFCFFVFLCCGNRRDLNFKGYVRVISILFMRYVLFVSSLESFSCNFLSYINIGVKVVGVGRESKKRKGGEGRGEEEI